MDDQQQQQHVLAAAEAAAAGLDENGGGGAAADAPAAAAAAPPPPPPQQQQQQINDGSSSDDDDDDDDDDDEWVDAEEDDEDEDEDDDDDPFGAGGGGQGANAESWAVVDPVRDQGLGRLGCAHYKRRCRLVAPCCGEVFWCRHCHNAAKDDGEQDLGKRHALDRKAVRELECAVCNLRQPVAETCAGCGVQFGRYSCLECNFFDDTTSKKQFHCDACGICRVGGRDNFFHCGTCNCCYSLALQESHVCVQNSMHQNCPVCFEYLFDSVRPITVLPCGHTIHQDCYHGLSAHDAMSLCPVCMRCTLSASHRERMWRDVDALVGANPMPPEHAGRRVDALCNDCSARSAGAAFHFIGVKCSRCGGYNTRIVG
jgi:RING finger/CHY zinc finger protein 1